MTLSIDLPPPLDEELAVEAEREGVSATEQATFLLHLMIALTREGRKTPFRSVVKAFLNQNSLDADRLADVCEGLMTFCLHDSGHSPIPDNQAFMSSIHLMDADDVLTLLRGWRSPAAHRSLDHDIKIIESELPPVGSLIQHMGRVNRISAIGKYSHLNLSSEAFQREKRLETIREDEA